MLSNYKICGRYGVLACLLTMLAPTAKAQLAWVNPSTAPDFGGNYQELNSLVSVAPGAAWGSYYRFNGGQAYTYSIFRTADNGATWAEYTTATNAGAGTSIQDFSALDTNRAWVLHSNSTASASLPQSLLYTTSGPGGFVIKSMAIPAQFSKIHFFDLTTGVGIAKSSANTWEVYRSTDGGATWTPVPTSLPVTSLGTSAVEELLNKEARGSSCWVTTSAGKVLLTADQGLTWLLADSGLGTELGSVVFRDAANGLAYRRSPYQSYTSATRRQLARTTDSGRTWQPLATPWPADVMAMVTKPGPTNRYIAVGVTNVSANPSIPGPYTGLVATSVDDGTSWQTLASDSVGYSKVAVSATGELWAGTYRWSSARSMRHMLFRAVGSPLAAQSPRATLAPAYPNPTTGPTHLHLKPGSQVRVYDATGRQLPCSPAAGLLDLSGYAVGLYHVVVTEPTGARQQQRLVVER